MRPKRVFWFRVVRADSFQARATPSRVDAPRGTAVIRGQIMSADTGAPIRRAQVRISSPDARESRVAATDAQGRFEVKELPAGRYTVTASKGGFVSLQYGQRRPSESGTPIELGGGWPPPHRGTRLQLARHH